VSTPIREALFELSHRVYSESMGMTRLHAVAVHPETMRRLRMELNESMASVRFAPGPFAELPGSPGDALLVDAPGGTIRVHVCRDVSVRDVSAYGLEGWRALALLQKESA